MSGLVVAAASAELLVLLGSAYVGVGAIAAWRMSARGIATTTALSAFAVWPMLLPLLHGPRRSDAHGPYADRIVAGLRDLRDTLAEPAAHDIEPPEDLDELVADLHRVDARLELVDRLLADVPASTPATPVAHSLASLRRARAAAAVEVEAVLDELVRLRLQIALRSLAGNSVPVRERLRDLRARLAAVDEIAALDLHA